MRNCLSKIVLCQIAIFSFATWGGNRLKKAQCEAKNYDNWTCLMHEMGPGPSVNVYSEVMS